MSDSPNFLTYAQTAFDPLVTHNFFRKLTTA